jgi:hypothetical protein
VLPPNLQAIAQQRMKKKSSHSSIKVIGAGRILYTAIGLRTKNFHGALTFNQSNSAEGNGKLPSNKKSGLSNSKADKIAGTGGALVIYSRTAVEHTLQ